MLGNPSIHYFCRFLWLLVGKPLPNLYLSLLLNLGGLLFLPGCLLFKPNVFDNSHRLCFMSPFGRLLEIGVILLA